ncbi:MAG: DUF4349 domain-containing protein [Eubacteriales bacterium]|nr:DUF4349 domain-containing protein [Eubacteriales bacterium]
MMKKQISLIMTVVLVFLLACSGCGSAKMNEAQMSAGADIAAPENGVVRPGEKVETETSGTGSSMVTDVITVTAGEAEGGERGSDKIIYSAYAELETQSFDETVAAVQELVDRYGGFIESSSVTGADYHKSAYAGRSARFTLRIPRQHFAEMTDGLSELGNVPYYESSAQNITPRYSDTTSRLNALRIEEERLFVMLEKAATIEEMLSIEARLSELRYEIESLTSTLQNWDSLISYSTLELYIREVADYTEEVPVQRSYWQQVGDDFRRSLQSVGDFFLGIFRFVVGGAPVIALLAVIVIPAGIFLRRFLRSHRRPKDTEDKE